MSRFKQVWSSFWRKDQGLGMIEAAIILPLFLVITFGVMEFGNMYMTRYQARDVASSVGDYLQANPSSSSEALQTFVTNLGFGSLKNTGSGEDNNVFAKIKIQSEKTMMTAAQFDALCSGGGGKNWANPWLGGDPADDKNDYYIHICYPYAYDTITPLSGLTAGAIPATKIMNNKAMAYITREISCPANQVLQSMTGGAATCVPRDNNYSCASGQTLEKIVDGNPVCVAKDGNYTCASGQVLKEITSGAAVCVDRDASYDCGDGEVLQKAQNGTATCVKAVCSGDQVLQKTQAGSAVCVDKDRGGANCTTGQVVTGVTNGVPTCSAAPAPSYGVFGGMYTSIYNGTFDGNADPYKVCRVTNPFTGRCTCPAWAPSAYGPFSVDSGILHSCAAAERIGGSGGKGAGCNLSNPTIIHYMFVCVK